MTKTVAIIGAGQIGWAAAGNFSFMGWNVSVYSRNRPHAPIEGNWYAYDAGTDPVPNADVVLDTIAFDEDDVIRYDPDAIGRYIAISSASVYCDAAGRTLDEAPLSGFPEFPIPIIEEQRTIAPGPETYSTRKVRMENKAMEVFGERATILRPCAIYGSYSRHPREWWFVKRLLDGRQRIPLAYDGLSQFQTTCAGDIAEFCEDAATCAWGGIYNIATENSPTALEIGQSIAQALGRNAEFRTFNGAPKGGVGRTPWSVPGPMIVSSKKSREAGDGLGDAFGIAPKYDIQHCARWLAELNPTDWCSAFPQLAAYPWDLFDYKAEDRFFDEGA